jgi:hypothetical protein
MQIELNPTPTTSGYITAKDSSLTATSVTHALANYQIIRRNGAVVPFEPNKIAVALMKAFLAVHGTQGAASASVREVVDSLTQAVVRALMRSRPGGGTFHIEDVQDQVELGLMRGSNHEVARAYVLYRERRTQERAQVKEEKAAVSAHPTLHVLDGGQRVPLDLNDADRDAEARCEAPSGNSGFRHTTTHLFRQPRETCACGERRTKRLNGAATRDTKRAKQHLTISTFANECGGDRIEPLNQKEERRRGAKFSPLAKVLAHRATSITGWPQSA